MRKLSASFLLSFATLVGCAQPDIKTAESDNTLLWRISGKDLKQPSYIFGTIHLLCKDDAGISANMEKLIGRVDEVYFEVDLDNMLEMMQSMKQMKMRGDTTLKDLLSEADYLMVKEYFNEKGGMLPFSMLEGYKPMLAASVISESSLSCGKTAMMEQILMEKAKTKKKTIQGLESMSYQLSILDQIPYKQQAEQLVAYIKKVEAGDGDNKELDELMSAYREQDLKKLEQLMMKSEVGLTEFTEILLFKRNRNWVEKLQTLLPGKTLLIAVGAGHLPGTEGVINLLRKAGYTVEPLDNTVVSGTTI